MTIEIPPQDRPVYQHAEIDEITDIEEVERKIKDTEASLRGASAEVWVRWFLLIGGSILIIPRFMKYIVNPAYWWMDLAVLAFLGWYIWRIYRAGKKKEKLEGVLSELSYKKGELQASLVVEG